MKEVIFAVLFCFVANAFAEKNPVPAEGITIGSRDSSSSMRLIDALCIDDHGVKLDGTFYCYGPMYDLVLGNSRDSSDYMAALDEGSAQAFCRARGYDRVVCSRTTTMSVVAWPEHANSFARVKPNNTLSSLVPMNQFFERNLRVKRLELIECARTIGRP